MFLRHQQLPEPGQGHGEDTVIAVVWVRAVMEAAGLSTAGHVGPEPVIIQQSNKTLIQSSWQLKAKRSNFL